MSRNNRERPRETENTREKAPAAASDAAPDPEATLPVADERLERLLLRPRSDESSLAKRTPTGGFCAEIISSLHGISTLFLKPCTM